MSTNKLSLLGLHLGLIFFYVGGSAAWSAPRISMEALSRTTTQLHQAAIQLNSMMDLMLEINKLVKQNKLFKEKIIGHPSLFTFLQSASAETYEPLTLFNCPNDLKNAVKNDSPVKSSYIGYLKGNNKSSFFQPAIYWRKLVLRIHEDNTITGWTLPDGAGATYYVVKEFHAQTAAFKGTMSNNDINFHFVDHQGESEKYEQEGFAKISGSLTSTSKTPIFRGTWKGYSISTHPKAQEGGVHILLKPNLASVILEQMKLACPEYIPAFINGNVSVNNIEFKVVSFNPVEYKYNSSTHGFLKYPAKYHDDIYDYNVTAPFGTSLCKYLIKWTGNKYMYAGSVDHTIILHRNYAEKLMTPSLINGMEVTTAYRTSMTKNDIYNIYKSILAHELAHISFMSQYMDPGTPDYDALNEGHSVAAQEKYLQFILNSSSLNHDQWIYSPKEASRPDYVNKMKFYYHEFINSQHLDSRFNNNATVIQLLPPNISPASYGTDAKINCFSGTQPTIESMLESNIK